MFPIPRNSTLNTTNAICRYQTLLGCGNINLTNTTDLYARFTTSVICNAIIQNSITPCGLSAAASRPVCANTCVSFPGQLSSLHLLINYRLKTQRARQLLLPTTIFVPTQAPMPTVKSEPTSLIVLYLPNL